MSRHAAQNDNADSKNHDGEYTDKDPEAVAAAADREDGEYTDSELPADAETPED